MTERAKEVVIIMLIILGLFAGACVIAGWMSEDIEAKSIVIYPSDERINFDSNEPKPFRSAWWDIERPPAMKDDPIDDMQQDFLIKLHENIVEHGRRSIINAEKISLIIDILELHIVQNEPIDSQIAGAMERTEDAN